SIHSTASSTGTLEPSPEFGDPPECRRTRGFRNSSPASTPLLFQRVKRGRTVNFCSWYSVCSARHCMTMLWDEYVHLRVTRHLPRVFAAVILGLLFHAG